MMSSFQIVLSSSLAPDESPTQGEATIGADKHNDIEAITA
jgi:hypothetical protein